MHPVIVEKHDVVSYGPYTVMEGDVIANAEIGEVTLCWVENEGKPVSRFHDIDYAQARAKMLSVNPNAPDMEGDIDVLYQATPYTILRANFGGEMCCWVVDSAGRLRTTPGAQDEAEAWVATKIAGQKN